MDSDHFMIQVKIRSRISNTKKKKGEKEETFKVDLLKDCNTPWKYKDILKTKLQAKACLLYTSRCV